MTYIKLNTPDRASGVLDSQLLSSQTSGSFTFSNLSNLGTQSWEADAGVETVITIEDEQILLSSLTESAGTCTATIATNGRGYNNTTAATHLSTTAVQVRFNKSHADRIQTHLKKMDDLGIINYSDYTPTITNASVHSISGVDVTSIFTVGRVYLFQVSGTWHRAIVRSSSFSTNTTINIDGDSLPASGTITALGFEYSPSTYKALDASLIKDMTAAPVNNPPAGYSWLYAKDGGLYLKNSAGASRPVVRNVGSASSTAGALTLDWSLAQTYDVALTENITGVTHSGGVDGQEYVLRITQHASSAKTVTLGTAGGTRFSNTITNYTATTTVSAVDILRFVYNATTGKYALMTVTKGFQASPAQAISALPTHTEIYAAFSSSFSPLSSAFNATVASDPDGTNVYVLYKTTNGNCTVLRYAMDTTTGEYYYTGTSVAITGFYNASNNGNSMYATASYVYVVGRNDTTSYIDVRRYAKDLTGATTLTVPAVAYTTTYRVVGDDTQFWVARSSTSVLKYTISGTTVTAGTGFTQTSSDNWQGAYFNGTDIIAYQQTSNIIRRMNTSTGTVNNSLTISDVTGSGIGLTYRSDGTIYKWTVMSVDATAVTFRVVGKAIAAV